MMNDSMNSDTNQKKSVLFLCTGNSCRSQMAEGWTRYLHKDRFYVYSAGITPQSVDPLAITVMAEAGVDISEQRSKHVNKLLDIPFDLIVMICDNAREACPLFPGVGKVVHQSFDDPPFLAEDTVDEDEAMSHYRRIRDEIRDFIADIPDLF
jgi:arsenate reductase